MEQIRTRCRWIEREWLVTAYLWPLVRFCEGAGGASWLSLHAPELKYDIHKTVNFDPSEKTSFLRGWELKFSLPLVGEGG